ncbi:mariner Mos1 transposase [Trichonephila clavipes]|nr:mariner Mos1 transposase [Trichonephila clavipes]
MLSPKQKEMEVYIFRDLIVMADKDDSFLKKIAIGNETWCFLNNPQPKRQSSAWKANTSPRKEKLRLDKSRWKIRRND